MLETVKEVSELGEDVSADVRDLVGADELALILDDLFNLNGQLEYLFILGFNDLVLLSQLVMNTL